MKPAPTAAARACSLAGRSGALCGGALMLAGCATVVLGEHEPFRIVSTPTGARVQLSTGATCITPCRLELPRAVAFQVRVSMSGYATQVLPVASRQAVSGAVGFLGNGIAGGMIGAGVDLDSGAMRRLSPNPLSVRLLALTVPNSSQSH